MHKYQILVAQEMLEKYLEAYLLEFVLLHLILLQYVLSLL